MAQLYPHIEGLFKDVNNPVIRTALEQSFASSRQALSTIEDTFKLLTAKEQTQDVKAFFFHNWSMTNNSAIGLSGYCNRLTMHWKTSGRQEHQENYLAVLTHLNRVSDEDLAATGGILHFDLFYRMATMISGNDEWLSRRYLLEAGRSFKQWKDRQMLRDKDLMIGLVTTLIHEIYTHGEVEFILPLFQNWLKQTSPLDCREQQHGLTWIACHCCGTERHHFNEALGAVSPLQRLLGVDIGDYDLTGIFCDYLQQKAGVMASLSEKISTSHKQVADAV